MCVPTWGSKSSSTHSFIVWSSLLYSIAIRCICPCSNEAYLMAQNALCRSQAVGYYAWLGERMCVPKTHRLSSDILCQCRSRMVPVDKSTLRVFEYVRAFSTVVRAIANHNNQRTRPKSCKEGMPCKTYTVLLFASWSVFSLTHQLTTQTRPTLHPECMIMDIMD